MDALIPTPVQARADPAADFAVTAATAVHAAGAALAAGQLLPSPQIPWGS
jgi:hypothetical protein